MSVILWSGIYLSLIDTKLLFFKNWITQKPDSFKFLDDSVFFLKNENPYF